MSVPDRALDPSLDPLTIATDAQRRATTPDQSAWVEANAGTGKTKVLTDRVTRLLLDRVKPERILCLTFTKAAAAEMRNRLASQLGRWAMATDDKLDGEIERLIDRAPDPAERVVARRLFARVLDAPGGINILTIHAFCQALLKRFPLEAGVAPGFEVLDEAEAQTLLRHAQDEQMEALARPDAPAALAGALASVASRISIAEYAELMTQLLGERAWLLARIADEAGLRRLRERLAREMGCSADDTADELANAACLEAAFDAAALQTAARALARGSKTDVSRAALMAEWLADAEGRPRRLQSYRQAFFTDKGAILKRLASKAAIEAMPDIEDVLRREAERLAAVLDRIDGAALVDRTLALLRLGLDIADRYARAKRRRAALDYDDLIVATRRLLESAESAAWVLYKLDGGIDHVLVDEAQDTNPDQWEVIRRLTEEFFVGEGAVDRARTVFAVGDVKQSIFGFQRADPRKLKEMREWFAERSRLADKRFVPVELNVSFRSTPAVLDAVDWVFDQADTVRGLAEPGDVIHMPSRKKAPGRVELWPLVSADEDEADTTRLDGAQDAATQPHQRLARLIAAHARSLIGEERRSGSGELLHAGHFMVLVRRRNEFVNALVKELKQAGIEVAGVDRLNLGEELAVQDLLAMARFVLLPQDDLNLACLLKSPLIGLSEDELFKLAWKRTGHLWRSLHEHARREPFAAAHARLAGWLRRTDYVTPFDFFAMALGAEGGRARLLERLGHEAADPIDELLARALQYQRVEGGSLQGFLRWFEAGGGEIKRDLDQNRRREVRILTVHASKGLQAPIVYLPDTTRVPRDEGRILSAADGEARLWVPRADDANEAARAWRGRARESALEEQNRLLYVAMTRAEDRLYVGGWFGRRRPDRGCWYERIEAGLHASSEAEIFPGSPQSRGRAVAREFDFRGLLGDTDGWAGEGYELVNAGTAAQPEQAELGLEAVSDLPSWARRPSEPEPDPPAPLAPSQPLPDEALAGPRAFSPLTPGDPRRWKRGQLLHELLRHLPALPAAERAEAARHYLGQPGHGLGEDEIASWAHEALAVTEAPHHAALFAPDSRAEVPLIGTVKTRRGTFTVSGQVDRLAVSGKEVLIVDYKTNRPPPQSAAGVALAYRRQLALYRALLAEIYPGRTVRAFLLWTAAPLLMEIDAKILDESMPYAAAS
jgi:ATP-dependent helicase/nuclease subunit A